MRRLRQREAMASVLPIFAVAPMFACPPTMFRLSVEA
jgi:hypothetical protein